MPARNPNSEVGLVIELSQDFWAAKQAEDPTSVPSPPVTPKVQHMSRRDLASRGRGSCI